MSLSDLCPGALLLFTFVPFTKLRALQVEDNLVISLDLKCLHIARIISWGRLWMELGTGSPLVQKYNSLRRGKTSFSLKL